MAIELDRLRTELAQDGWDLKSWLGDEGHWDIEHQPIQTTELVVTKESAWLNTNDCGANLVDPIVVAAIRAVWRAADLAPEPEGARDGQ